MKILFETEFNVLLIDYNLKLFPYKSQCFIDNEKDLLNAYKFMGSLFLNSQQILGIFVESFRLLDLKFELLH